MLVRSKTQEEANRTLSWRDDRFYFVRSTLGEIKVEFNRYNDKRRMVDGAAVSVRLGGSFEATDLSGFVGLVRDGFRIRVTETEAQIRLSK